MISSCMFSTTTPTAKTRHTMGMIGLDRVVGSGHNDLAVGDSVMDTVVLAGRQNPTERGGYEHTADQQRKRVWEA